MRKVREEDRPVVLQMLSADGWRAVWAGDDGEPWADPLVCWALVSFNDDNEMTDLWPAMTHARQAIIGMATGLDGWVDATEGGNFLGYSAPGESLDCWKVPAQEYVERQKKKREAKP